MAAKRKARAKKKPRKKASKKTAKGPGDKHRSNTAGLMPPWKPGQSGNPKGRPKKQTLEEELSQYLQAEIADADSETGEVRITRLHAMVRKIFALGVDKENAQVLIAIMDRLYPKPIVIKGDPEAPIAVEHQDLSRYSTGILREMAAVDKKIAAELSGQ